jgi:hypothetical protein
MHNAELTAKQARFLHEYLVDGNGAGAAVRAGYGVAGAKVTACRMLTRPNVQKALQARQAADATRLSISRDCVVAGLLEAVDQARVKGDPAAMISGWKEIGRMLGLYSVAEFKVDVSVGADIETIRLNALSDFELMALIEAGQLAAAA